MHKRVNLIKTAALLLLLGAFSACGGGGAPTDGGDHNPAQGGGFTLSVLRGVDGIPSGVRVSWTRVDVDGIDGYYIYRATSSTELPDGDPAGHSANRVNGGSIIGQSGSGTDTLTFDDSFNPPVGGHYWYRMTVVNPTHDESDFSNQLDIVIAGHTVDSITTTPVSIGDQVTITGTHFGAVRNGDQVYFTQPGGSAPDQETDSYVSWSDTEIVVTVPYGAGDGPVGVKIGDSQVNSADSISYNEPVLATIDPGEDWVQHNTITLTGTDFGPSQAGGGDESAVYFGGAPTLPADVVSWTTTEIQVKVPALAAGMAVQVHVDVAGNASNDLDFYLLPHVESLNPSNGNAGTSVTIAGSNFGVTQSTGFVRMYGTLAVVTNWTNSNVTITIPLTALDGDVELTRSDGRQANSLAFDVVPAITSINPARRMVGEQMTIYGSGFGTGQGASVVLFTGGVAATEIVSWGPGQIVVTIPPGAATGPVSVGIADASAGNNEDTATSASSLAILLPPPDIGDIGQL